MKSSEKMEEVAMNVNIRIIDLDNFVLEKAR